jgi:hypothetical protein
MYKAIISAAFFLELRIVARHVAFEPVWLYTRLTPDPLHRRFAEPERCRQFPARPVCTAIRRRLCSFTEYFGLHCGRHSSRLAAPMLRFQPRHSIFFETLSSARSSDARYSVPPRSACSSCRRPEPESAMRRTHPSLPECATATTASVPRVPSQSVAAIFHSLPHRARRLEVSNGYRFA